MFESLSAQLRLDGRDYCMGGSGLLGFKTVSRHSFGCREIEVTKTWEIPENSISLKETHEARPSEDYLDILW